MSLLTGPITLINPERKNLFERMQTPLMSLLMSLLIWFRLPPPTSTYAYLTRLQVVMRTYLSTRALTVS